MIRTFALTLLLCSSAALAQNAQDLPDAPGAMLPQAKPQPTPTGPTVIMDTSMGRLTCKLFDKVAPVASANFIGLATGAKDWADPLTSQKKHNTPLYDGTIFHRVIPGFMIQGGDPTGTGSGDGGYYFDNEVDPALTFSVAGRLAMANAGPNTNSSQFFITEAPQPELGNGYTIFGQCDPQSVAVVAQIARVPRNAQDKPLDPVTLKKVTIVREGQPIPPDPMPPAAPPASAAAPSPAAPAAPAAH